MTFGREGRPISLAPRVLLLVGLSATLAVTACSLTPPAPIDRSAFTPDAQVWRLPLDEYAISDAQSGESLNVYLHSCAQSAGISIPLEPEGAYQLQNATPTGQLLFTLSIARRLGYHSAFATPQLNTPEPSGLDAKQLAAVHRCDATAAARFTGGTENRQFVQGVAYAAYVRAHRAPRVLADARRWRNCMLPEGIGDLPDDPTSMPSPSVRHKYLGAGTHASSGEIRLAVTDAKCRMSSGYQRDLYQAEITAQWFYMDQNVTRLDAALAAKKQASAQIAMLLRRSGR